MSAPCVSATAFVLDVSGAAPGVRRWLPVRVVDVTSRDLMVPTRYGPIRARLYRPTSSERRTVAVFPGVHPGGVDEPRLAAFSRRLAATGAAVLSVPLPELRRYRVTPVSTDMIEDAAVWLAANRSLAPNGRIDMAAISFSGGLALVAAGRPSLDGKVGRVISLGGHADLPRVMTYLCTGALADGGQRAPHEVAVGVVLLRPSASGPARSDRYRRAGDRFLDALGFSDSDPRNRRRSRVTRRMADEAPEPTRACLTW